MTRHADKKSSSIDKVSHMVHQLMQEQFFGELSISFQNGRPHTIKVHRTLKLDDL